MNKVVSINSFHPLIGSWKAANEFSDVLVSTEANEHTKKHIEKLIAQHGLQSSKEATLERLNP